MHALLLALSFLAASDKLGASGDSCMASADCEQGLECRAKECVPVGSFSTRERNTDCPGELRCRDNQCLAPGMKISAPTAPAAPTPAAPYYLHGQTLPYREGCPIPPGAHVEERNKKALWITGLVLFSRT